MYLDWKARGDCKKNSLRSSEIKFGVKRVENFATSRKEVKVTSD